MKKLLKKQNEEIYYYKDNVKTVIDRNNKTTYPVNIYGNITSGLSGDITGLTGNISSELTGNITGLYGNITGLYGNISSRLTGNITGLTGNISGLKRTKDRNKY